MFERNEWPNSWSSLFHSTYSFNRKIKNKKARNKIKKEKEKINKNLIFRRGIQTPSHLLLADTLNSISSLLNLQSPGKRNTENNTKIFGFPTDFRFRFPFCFCFSSETGGAQLILQISQITTRAPSEVAAGTGGVSASRNYPASYFGYSSELCIDLGRRWLGMSSSFVRPCEVSVRSWSFWFLGLSASRITPSFWRTTAPPSTTAASILSLRLPFWSPSMVW